MNIPGSLTYAGKNRRGLGRWEYRIDISRDPITGKRSQKSKTFYGSRKYCEGEAIKYYTLMQEGGIQRLPAKMAYAEYLIKHWLPNVGVRSRVKETYSSIVRTHLVPDIGNILLSELNRHHIREYFNSKSTGGRKDGKLIGLSSNTLKNHLIVIRKSLADAVVYGYIEYNPAILPKGHHFFASPKRIPGHPFTQDDARMFVQEAANEGNYYGALLTSFFMGTRRSETCALQWGDVDLDNRLIRVRRTLHVLKGGCVVIEEPKSEKSKRNVPIPKSSPLVRVLTDLKMGQKLTLAVAGMDLMPDDWVFARDDFSPIRPQQLTKAFKRVAKRIGRPDMVLHGLRHNYATDHLRNSTDIHTLSELLGHHRKGYTLDAYIDEIPNAGRDAVDRLYANMGFDDVL